jgi:hypothetical protein
VDMFDAMYQSQSGVGLLTYACGGHYMARTYGGGGTSINVGKLFDSTKCIGNSNVNAGAVGAIAMLGVMQTPNGPDNSLYLSPVSVYESTTSTVRGRLRGIYQVCHPLASFSDGQTFSGGGDYAGKTFQVISKMVNGGFCAVETSATVETN